jgi:beta-glucanase (GH16 family)
MIFDSEFSGSTLSESQWSTGAWATPGIGGGYDGELEQDCYDPSRVSMAGGTLEISAIAKEETCSSPPWSAVSQPYTTGAVTTDGKFSFTFGYMEARIWLPGPIAVADWPAFWAVGARDTSVDGEIDVVEGLGGQACATFHNASGAEGPTCPSGTFTAGWNTFAANWEPGSITYYYNGRQIAQYSSRISTTPMFLVLDLALSSSITSPDTLPATMLVDYVRVWRHQVEDRASVYTNSCYLPSDNIGSRALS